MENKTKLRQQAKEIRKTLDIKKISQKIINIIKETCEYKQAKNIMIFYPMKYEIDLLELLSDKSKNFFLPRVNEKELEVCPFSKGDTLKKSEFNVYEPIIDPISPQILDIVIIPALMADSQNYRLGYGKGFYDRFINKYGKNFYTITTIPNELYISELPTDKHDQKVDKIIIA